jgi:spore coat protein U-like protein
MVAGIYYLYYNLYRDAAFQQIWGNGNSGSNTVTLNNPVNGQNNIHTSTAAYRSAASVLSMSSFTATPSP